MSGTLSLVLLIVILSVSLVLAVIVFVKVRRGDWLESFRLDRKNRQGPGEGGK